MTPTESDFFLGADCAPDILGLNYYLTSDRFLDHRLDRYPAAAHGGNGMIRYADVEAVEPEPRALSAHHEHLLAAWTRYKLPLAITEVHLGCTREEQLRWLVESWQAPSERASRARTFVPLRRGRSSAHSTGTRS